MSIIFLFGKMFEYYPDRKNIRIRIPYQKEKKDGDEIIIDKVVKNGEEYGQPFLPIVLIGKIVKKRVTTKKIGGMTYKRKKRVRKTKFKKNLYTLIEIVSVKDKSELKDE